MPAPFKTRISALRFERRYSPKQMLAYAQEHGLAVNSSVVKGSLIEFTALNDEHEYRWIAFGDGVRARIEIVGGGAMVGRMTMTSNGGGAAPAHDVPPLPDYQAIYMTPESEAREGAEREMDVNRRYATNAQAMKRFGQHGVSPPEPVLKYETEHYTAIIRDKPEAPVIGTSKPIAPALKHVVRGGAEKPKEKFMVPAGKLGDPAEAAEDDEER